MNAEDDIRTILLYSKPNTTGHNYSVAWAYNDTLNLGKNFSLMTTMWIGSNVPNDEDHKAVVPTYDEVTVGKYTLRMERPLQANDDDESWKRVHFVAVLYKDGQEIARTDDYLDDGNYATFGGDYAGDRYLATLWIGASNAKKYMLEHAPDSTGMVAGSGASFAGSGAGTGPAFKDFYFVVRDGKLQLLDSNKDVIAFGDKTEFEVAEDDFTAANVSVMMQADGLTMAWYSQAIMRMKAVAADTAEALSTTLGVSYNGSGAGSGSGSGSGSGNGGSGNGSGNGGAAKTSDTRNIVLPLAILMACVSAAGLILVNRKQRV